MTDLSVAVRIAAQEEVSAVSQRAAQGLQGLEQAGGRANSMLGTLGQGLSAGLGFAAASAGIAGITSAFGGLVGAAAGFESQMSAISAVSAGAGGRMSELSGLALKLGKDTSFSAAEAGKGIEELVKAGVSIETIIGGGASAALSLAAAGAVDVGQAAEIASNAVNAFSTEANAFAGGPGQFLFRTADLIAGAANASAIDVNEFKFSLSAVGAVAATVGLSFEDTTTAIAELGNAGIKGSDAGTSLKTMLLNLQPSTKAQTAEFLRLGLATADWERANGMLIPALQSTSEGQKKLSELQSKGADSTENLWKAAEHLGLGVTKGATSFERWLQITDNMGNSFFDAQGKAKGLADISGALQHALHGMTEQEKLASLEILFGSDAIRAAAVLAKEGAAGFNTLNAEINKTTAADVARTRLDNLKGSLEQFKGSGETLAIMLGGLLTPALRGLVDAGTVGLNALITMVERIPILTDTISQMFAGKDMKVEFAEFFSNMGLSEGLVTAVYDAIHLAGDAWRTIGQVFEEGWEPDATIDPIVNAIGMIAIVARDQVLPAVQTASAAIQGALTEAFNAVGPAVAMLVTGFQGLLAIVQENYPVQVTLAAVVGAVGVNMAVAAASSLAFAAASGVATVASGVFRVAMLAVNLVMAANPVGLIVTALGALVGAFIYAYNTSDEFRAVVDTTWEAVKTAFTAGWAVAQQVLTDLVAYWQSLPEGWAAVGQVLSDAWALLWPALLVVAQAGWDLIVAGAQAAWDLIVAGVDTYLFQPAQAAMQAGWQMVQDLWTSSLQAIADLYQSVLDALFTRETQAKFGILVGVLGELWSVIVQLFTAQLTLITQTVTTAWEAISTATTAVWTTVSTFFTTWWTELSTLFQTSLDAVVAFFAPAWALISTEIDTVWTAITAVFTTTWAAISKIVDDGLNLVWTYITTKGAEIVTGVTTWLGEITAGFTNQVSIWSKAGTDMGTGLMDAIKSLINSAAQGIIDSLTSLAQRAISAVRGALPGGGRGGSVAGVDVDRIAVEEGLGASGGGLLRSLIEQESKGNQGARSGAGAIGLTQLMPGTAASLGVDPYDPEQNVRGGARYLAQMIAQFGDTERALIAYNAGPGGGSPEESRAYAQRVIAGIGNTQRGAAIDRLNLTQDQTIWGAEAGLSMSEAQAVCGPYAAFAFAQATGRTPTRQEALQLARQNGWGVWGMGGTQNFMNLLGDLGVNAVRDPTPTGAEAAAAVQAGQPVAFSTARHYFEAQGYDPNTKQFDLGATGTTMASYGGQRFMTFEQISQVGGGMQDLIILAGQMGAALEAGSAKGGAAFNGLLVSATTLADGSKVAIIDMGGQIVATVTNAAGEVIGQFGAMSTGGATATATMAASVTQQYDMMSSGALVSVAAMGDSTITTARDAAGNIVTTVTDMSGKVLNQYATLNTGATLSIQDMNVKSTASVDQMTGNITRTVTDAMGNVITTVTSSTGAVLQQYVTTNAAVTADQAATAATMVATNTDTGAKLLSDTTTALGNTIQRYRETNGDIVTTVTDQNGKVLANYTTTAADIETASADLGTQLIARTKDDQGNLVEIYREANGDTLEVVKDASSQIVKEYRNTAKGAEDAQGPVEDFYGVLEETPTIDLRDTVKQLKDVEKQAQKTEEAAKDAAEAIKDIGQAEKGGSKSSKEFAKKAEGGPVGPWSGDVLVGEEGPEIVRFSGSGYVIPNRRAFGSGSGDAGVVQSRVEHHYHLEQTNYAQADVGQIDSRTRRTFDAMAAGWGFRRRS